MLQQGESEFNNAKMTTASSNIPCKIGGYMINLILPFVCPSVKDKAEILLQVEELLHIKEELSSQVCYEEERDSIIRILVYLCAFK